MTDTCLKDEIRTITGDAKRVCNVKIKGETIKYKVFLEKKLGASKQIVGWEIKGDVNRDLLLSALKNQRIQIDIDRVPGGAYNGNIWLEFEYDEVKHHRLSKANGCKCTETTTCRPCKVACCEKAKSIFEKRFSGEVFECPEHKKRYWGTDAC